MCAITIEMDMTVQVVVGIHMIDIEEELKILENSVRDIIIFVLSQKHGNNWINKLKLTNEHIKKWHDRKAVEETRLKGKVLDSRLIYYSDFYDLRTIIC